MNYDDRRKAALDSIMGKARIFESTAKPSVEDRISVARSRLGELKLEIEDEYLSEYGIDAVEEYVKGHRACASCKSLDTCGSVFGGHLPVLATSGSGRGVILLRPCPRKIQADEQSMINEGLATAGIPEGYSSMGFRTFQATEGTRNAIDNCLQLSKDQLARGLVLYGPTGTGKTHLAVATIRNWMASGRSAAYISAPDIIDRMRGDYGEAAQKVLDAIESTGLLLLDDLGSERHSDYATEQIFRIIDRCTISGRKILVTTNYDPAELVAKYGGVEGERIVSRLKGLGTWIEVQGRDHREDQ